MRILITNDDGVHAPGIHALFNELKRVARVWIVAPMDEKSTTGHSLTLHKPLRMSRIQPRIFGVNGSPADCVAMGIREVIRAKPDFVVSGVNRGANLGQDIYYSGTVSAAREACILGIPAIAVSLAVDFRRSGREDRLNYATAAKLTSRLISSFQAMRWRMPEHTLLNLNVPDLPMRALKGLELGKQGFRHYSGSIVKRRDHRGRDYYWVGGQYLRDRQEEGTDCMIVKSKKAALTPLRLDCTDGRVLAGLDAKTLEVSVCGRVTQGVKRTR